MTSLNCTVCGNPTPRESASCVHCGHRLQNVPKPEEPEVNEDTEETPNARKRGR